MERKYKEELGKDIKVSDAGPIPGVHFAYALDISRCIGCRRCVYACVAENNQSRDPQIHWIRVFSMEKEKGVDFSHADPYYNPPRFPRKATSTSPSAASSARIRRAPRSAPPAPPGRRKTASWSSTTTGASAAATAWPPALTARATSTGPSPPSPRTKSIPTPTTWATGRGPKAWWKNAPSASSARAQGRYPACVEVCPVGARKFGNLLDTDSEIRYIIEHKRVLVLKEELNTVPRFFYFYAT